MTELELRIADRVLTGPDFCHVCGRVTDHFAEHSDEQLEATVARGGWIAELVERRVAAVS